MKMRYVLAAVLGLAGITGCGSDETVPAVVTEEQRREMDAAQKAVEQEEGARARSLKKSARPVDQAEYEERRRMR